MHTNGKHFMSLMVFITVLSLAACRERLERPHWLADWLDSPTCQPPCWDGIVPGGTTRDEMRAILSQSPNVFDVESGEVIPYGLSLNWFLGKRPGEGGGFAAFDVDNIVQLVDITVTNEGLYLDNFTSIYGSPESIVFRDWISGPGYVSVDLLYPKSGMAVGLYLDNLATKWNDAKVKIQCNAEIWHVRFFKPDLVYYYTYLEIPEPLMQYDWKGCITYP